MKEQGRENFIGACLDLQEIAGKVSASFTHEIKNQLTVIKEQASLLQDLSVLAAKKGGLDPARVEDLSGRIVDRVRRTDEMVKRFNAFAHSSDEPLGSLEAGESLALMIDLHQRLADRAQVALEYEEPAERLAVNTRPQFLLAAVFACLQAAVSAAPEHGRVRAWVEADGDEACFAFDWRRQGYEAVPEGPGGELLAVLGARMEEMDHGHGMRLCLPRGGGG